MRGREREELDSDKMLLFAVVRAIEIIGEGANQVSTETRQRFSTIPWRAATSMRNRLIHGYFDIDTEIVWETVESELPRLVENLVAILAKN